MPPSESTVRTPDGVELAVEQAGEGHPVLLLHGLTATRRYVVMGSRLLERSGCCVIAYDARGHGRSSPAPSPQSYAYPLLAADLEAVMDAMGLQRATLAGASMGAHTIVRFALDHPDRVAAIALITPAFDPEAHADRERDADGEGEGEGEGDAAFDEWDALARGLREGGVEGFIAAYNLSSMPKRWRATVLTVVRQRLSAHLHPEAVADALEAVPRSRPFEAMSDLERIVAPTLVVASRDESDPSHPLAVGERYAAAISGSRLLVETPGTSPIAWQGAQLSRALLDLINAAA